MTAPAEPHPHPYDAEETAAYCFGDLSPSERDRFEQHLLTCDGCWAVVQRLARAVEVLRTDLTMKQTLFAPDVAEMLGLSGGLDRTFAGHGRYVAAAAIGYGALYGVAYLVEAAYAFTEYSNRIALAVFVAVVASLAVALLSFWTTVRRARSGSTGLAMVTTIHIAGTALLCLYLISSLPSQAIVRATFQTFTAQMGYVKSVVYFWILFLPFILAPFQTVVTLQKELRDGRCHEVVALLTGDRHALTPRGMLFPSVRVLGWVLLMIAIKAVIDVNYLFGRLLPDTHMNLFMFFELVRVVGWFAVAGIALPWYARSLNELKRVAFVVQSFGVEPRAMRS